MPLRHVFVVIFPFAHFTVAIFCYRCGLAVTNKSATGLTILQSARGFTVGFVRRDSSALRTFTNASLRRRMSCSFRADAKEAEFSGRTVPAYSTNGRYDCTLRAKVSRRSCRIKNHRLHKKRARNSHFSPKNVILFSASPYFSRHQNTVTEPVLIYSSRSPRTFFIIRNAFSPVQ